MFREVNYRLPKGHKSVAACVTLEDAQKAAGQLIGRTDGAAYYIMDKRGAYEVIEYQANHLVEGDTVAPPS